MTTSALGGTDLALSMGVAILGLLASVGAAYLTARSTAIGGREQAIDTETLRSRSRIAERRLEQFDAALCEFGGYVQPRLFTYHVHSGETLEAERVCQLADAVYNSALLVPSPQDWTVVHDHVGLFNQVCADIAKRQRQGTGAVDVAVARAFYPDLSVALFHVQYAVDWAAERRIQRTRSGLLSDFVPQWAEKVKADRDALGPR